jgi:hypothetical protein
MIPFAQAVNIVISICYSGCLRSTGLALTPAGWLAGWSKRVEDLAGDFPYNFKRVRWLYGQS